MNRKIIGFAIIILAIAMFVSPVMAIGPQKAVKNPNIVLDLGWAMMNLPSGQFTEWVPSADLGTILFQHKSVDDFQIRNALVMAIHMATEATSQGVADMMTFYGEQNHWIYLTQNSYFNFLFNSFVLKTDIPTAISIATTYASLYPNGLYIRFVIIGNATPF